MLKITHLVKYYGDVVAVKDLSLELNRGEVFGFIGPNGAGKSTTIKCILNFISKTEGEILLDDKIIDDDAKNKIGYLPSEIHLYDDLTVKEMFSYQQSFYKENHQQRRDYLIKKLEVDVTKRIDDLSFGTLKKVGIILAMMHEPELLILDEPTSGLDPLMQEVFFELLQEEKKKGTTIFFSSHILGEVQRISDRVGVIKEGKLITVQTTEEICKSDFCTVTLISEFYKKLKLPIKDMIIKEKSASRIKFIYKGDMNTLIHTLSEIDVLQLKVEEPSLEDILMHYYK